MFNTSEEAASETESKVVDSAVLMVFTISKNMQSNTVRRQHFYTGCYFNQLIMRLYFFAVGFKQQFLQLNQSAHCK